MENLIAIGNSPKSAWRLPVLLNQSARPTLWSPANAATFHLAAMTRFFIIISATAVWIAAPNDAIGQDAIGKRSHNDRCLTGKALHRRLNSPVSVSWTQAPLADRLKAFAANKQFAVFIDRRIDPNAKVDLRRINVTIEQLLLELANELGIGVCQVDDLIYFGPLVTAQTLPVIWDDLSKPSRAPASHAPATALKWNELSCPQELMKSIADNGNFKIIGMERIHHDLWDSGSLPPLTPIQQVAMIAVGFEQWPTVRSSGKILELRKIQRPSRGKIEYVRSPIDASHEDDLKQKLQENFPELKFRLSRDTVRMTGKIDQLYAAKAFLIQQNRIGRPDSANVRFTLKTSATRVQILTAIAAQTGRELMFDPTFRSTLDQQVEIECRQVSLDELVDQILTGSGLQAETTSSAIEISQ